MPLYSYRCDTCPPFDIQAPMAESQTPRDCPACARPAKRHYGINGIHYPWGGRQHFHDTTLRSERAQMEALLTKRGEKYIKPEEYR